MEIKFSKIDKKEPSKNTFQLEKEISQKGMVKISAQKSLYFPEHIF